MKLKKVLIIIFISICIICLVPEHAFAEEDSAPNIAGIISGMNGVQNVNTEGSRIKNVINAVIKLIQVAGTGISLVMVTMLGIKYMLASANEKADIKKMATPMVIGCILLFAAVNLVAVIASFGDELNTMPEEDASSKIELYIA